MPSQPRAPRKDAVRNRARLVDADASGDGHEDVAGTQRDAAVAGQHREHQRQAVSIDSVGHAARWHQLAGRHERLQLDEQRPRALHGAEHHRARRPRRLADKARARVLDLDEPALGHLEDAHLVGGAEAVLERPQGAVGALTLALEGEHAVEIGLGHANADIARRLYMSEATVKSHITHLFDKLSTTNRVQLAIAAFRAGLVD